jgi:hypothetical protein
MSENDDQNSDPPLPWPNVTDKIFTRGEPDWHNNAMLMHGYGDRWAVYAIGYKEAADIVVNRVKDGHDHQDFLVYPVMFLYRQYLELMIKSLIRNAWKLLDEDEGDDLSSHDIKAYWKICRALLERISPSDSVEELGHIGRLIDEFCQHDPGSFAFRYPVSKPDKKSKKRTPTLQQVRVINLRNVQGVITNVAGLLEGAEGLIDQALDMKADMEAWHAP